MDPSPTELTIFEAARHIADGQKRAAYLDEACRENPALRKQVEELLALQTEADHEYEPAAREAAQVMVEALSAAEIGPAPERPGDRIGPYQLVRQLGEGGCGVVYLAEQQEPLRRQVALKVIKLGMDTREVIARFEAERQALAVMDHPNIAKVHDAGTTSTGRPYFVMELVQGLRMTEFCDRHNLSTVDRLQLFIQVCQAVQHAHQKGIIHRDLKPSNVLVTLQDGPPSAGVPKVIDFGIAKATTGQRLTDKTIFTAFDQFLGTPAYMSPEQAELSGLDIDTRSDVYSLGVLLYELLTGGTPFDARELLKAGFDEMRRMLRETEPPKPSTRLGGLVGADLDTVASRRQTDALKLLVQIRGDLDWIVMKCLEKDRNRRYDSATGLAQDVQRYLRDEPVLAGPPTAAYRLRKFVRKNRRAVAVVAAILPLLAAAAIGGTLLAFWANRERLRALDAKKEAQTAQREAQAVLKFFEDRVLSATRPRGQKGGLGHDATIREALFAADTFIGDSFKNSPLVEASIRDVLANSYIHLGAYSNAIEHDERALALWQLHQGSNSARAFSTMNNLATAWQKSGNLRDAIPLLEAVLEFRRRELGPEHPDVLVSMNNLASAYSADGRKDEALKMDEETLRIRKATLGIPHPYTLSSMSSVGAGYRLVGRLPEAVATLTEALELHKTHLQPDHAYTTICAEHLAKALLGSGRTNEALPLFQEVLRMTRTNYPAEHPNTTSALRNLGNLYVDVGRPAEACPLFEEAWKAERSRSGPTNLATLRAQNRLADALAAAARSAEAIPLASEALRGSLKALTPDHRTTTYALEILANASRTAGRIREALPLLEDFLQRAENGPAATNRYVYRSTEIVARAWMEGDLPAKELSPRLVATLEQSLGQQAAGKSLDKRTLALLELVAGIHVSRGQPERAQEWHRKMASAAQ